MASNAARRAVVLLSGGLDSATVLAIARDAGYECYALSFDYGQRHRVELEAADRVARAQGACEHRTMRIDLGGIGGSALTDPGIAVPEHQSGPGIPVTYVPARNTLFLALALGWAEVLGATDLFIGVTAVDYSGYPDCRPNFIEAFCRLANIATKSGVEGTVSWQVHAPLINLTKADIIRQGLSLGIDYGITHSCYDPDSNGHACGRCDSCAIRLRGFSELGINDPAIYVPAHPQNESTRN